MNTSETTPPTHSHFSHDFAERLVTLSDGRSGLRTGLQVEISEPAPLDTRHSSPDTSPTLDFIASDETLDRSDEVIAASGWRLESYRRNPVFQNAHQYGDIIFTLGKALITEIRIVAGRPALFQRVQFATEANPMARIAYALYKGKFLNAVSVGFIPLRWENGDGSLTSLGARHASLPFPDASPVTRHSSLPNFRRRYVEQELLEVSAVGIPANPNALQLGLKAGVIQKQDLQELVDLLSSLASSEASAPGMDPTLRLVSETQSRSGAPISHFRSNPAVPDTHTCALGVRGYEAQLLRLAREVRRVIRKT